MYMYPDVVEQIATGYRGEREANAEHYRIGRRAQGRPLRLDRLAHRSRRTWFGWRRPRPVPVPEY